jgi:hypothetical protein
MLRLDDRFAQNNVVALICHTILASPGYLILIFVQFLFALAIISRATGALLALSVSGILVVKLLSHLRSPYGGLDGSDQMQVILFSSLAVFYLVPGAETQTFALLFIAAQALLSYLSAGLAKLVSPAWRSGAAISGIMSTDNYGSRIINSWMQKNMTAAAVLCWMVILFECLAPATVFAGPVPCLVFIGCALVFHLTIAFIMGLNTFVWSFGATYPAILFLTTFVR